MSTLSQPAVTRQPSSHDRLWRGLAVAEVTLALAAVVLDLLLPAVVIAGLAGVSLVVRRTGPASLGFHRVDGLWRLALQTFGLAVAWTLVNFAISKPLLEHVSGERQDLSAFEDLQGNVGLLVLLLAVSWTLAAFLEELAFRGFVQTRMVEVLGRATLAVPLAVLVTSVLFGLLHTEYGLIGVVVSAVDGVFYSVLRYHYRTLWASILAHGFIDTIGLVTVFAVGPVYGLW